MLLARAGRGYGLVAADMIDEGALVMIVPPLAMARGSGCQVPSLAQLVDQLSGHPDGLKVRDLLEVLSGPGKRHADGPAPSLDGMATLGRYATTSGTDAAAAPLPLSRSIIHNPLRYYLQQNAGSMGAKLAANVYGCECEDRASSRLRGRQPGAHLGLWPEFSVINHACSPSAVHYVAAGGYMVVRALRTILPGMEVTVNYVGR